ncbi:MAG: C40 family peptidase [Bacteroidota bacterium]|nr:C40 family peptidase [Bacteroidota bacterium]
MTKILHMDFVYCKVPAAPLRKEAAHRSEMVSQLLFGETAEILAQSGLFTQLRCRYDGYEGWCQTSQLCKIGAAEVENQLPLLSGDWDSLIEYQQHPMHIPMGASLGLWLGDKKYSAPESVKMTGTVCDPATTVFSPEAIRERAFQYLNTPYLWGGRSVYGIDCSGFAQQVYRFFHRPLPRDAWQQAGIGEVVGFLQESVCGDLAFFDNEEGKITHVGILLGTDTLIHSSGQVRVDRIDTQGILNAETGERTHRLRIIKRYVN